MHIFQQEYDDGIDAIISANSSVAYVSEVQPCVKEQLEIAKADIQNNQTIAALNDEDLYYVQSILVSSSWNKNDDVFDKAEVWKAKSTPEDKPTNLEHDEGQIVGHIVSNWPIDTEGKKIPENTDISALPDKFHIVTGSVIYRNFTNPELKDRAEDLIDEIKGGSKFVSMECYFNNFDYGLVNKETGEYKVLERNNKTSHLTKHLRAYGGLGEYDDYKIGRVLRNINFSGKGFVDKPANPESIIFDVNITEEVLSKKNNIPLTDNSVSNIQASLNLENQDMSLEKDIESLKDKVEAMNGCGEVLKEAYSRVSELEVKVVDLEATMQKDQEDMKVKEEKNAQMLADMAQKEEEEKAEKAKKDAELEEAEVEKATKEAELEEVKASELKELTTSHEEIIKAKDTEIEALTTELAAATETIDAYKAKEVEMAKQAQIMSRVSELVEAGVKLEVAQATVSKFETLDDESFATIKSLVGTNMPEWAQVESEESAEAESTEETKPEVEAEVQTESTVSEEVLENVEVEAGVDLSVGSEDDSAVDSTRASLVDFVYSRLGKQQSNKGE